jgi:hypothetical protein
MIDHDPDAAGLQHGEDLRRVTALDVGMNVPVKIGEAADSASLNRNHKAHPFIHGTGLRPSARSSPPIN